MTINVYMRFAYASFSFVPSLKTKATTYDLNKCLEHRKHLFDFVDFVADSF